MDKARLLLVDDQPELLRLMGTYLPRAGYAVTCCATAGQALEALASPGPAHDAAIVDMWLPDMDGRELVSRMASGYPELRILIASGAALDTDSLGVELAGRICFLQKPYVPRTLIDSLERLLCAGR